MVSRSGAPLCVHSSTVKALGKATGLSSPAPAEFTTHVAAGRSARRRRPAPDQAGHESPGYRQCQTHQAVSITVVVFAFDG